jgi:hypothetical protein
MVARFTKSVPIFIFIFILFYFFKLDGTTAILNHDALLETNLTYFSTGENEVFLTSILDKDDWIDCKWTTSHRVNKNNFKRNRCKKKKFFFFNNLSKQIPFCITVSLSWRRGHISYRDDNANGRRQRAIGRMLVRHRSFCWSTDWNLLHCHFKLLDGKFLIANHLWLIQCHISSISFGFRLVVSWNL